MRILIALVFILAACSKKKEGEGDKPAPKQDPAPVTKTEEKKPTTDPAPDEKPTPTEPAPVEGGPSKDAAIQRMRDMLAALEAKDYKKAATFMAVGSGMSEKDLEEGLGSLLKQKEISAKGIDIVAAKGEWGKLADVMGADQAGRYAERFKVKVEDCWGFKVTSDKANATVGFHWDGKDLKFIRLNNVGKLE